jgi:hypothetical protein
MEDQHKKRVGDLEVLASEHLEQIPTDITHEELLADAKYKNHFFIYEECIEWINALQQEIEYGKVVPIDH